MKKIGALMLALALLLGLVACGGESDDPNVGMWHAVSASMMGFDMEVDELFEDGVSLEVKANGKFTISVDGEKGSGKWEYTGSGMRMTASGVEMDATIEDGLLTLTNLLNMGMDLTFEKEGGYAAAAGGAAGKKAAGDAGYYVVDTLSDGDTTMEREMLLEYGLNWYILLEEDGTAQVDFDGIMTGTWEKGTIDLGDAGVLDYTLQGDIMTMEIDGETMTLRRSDDKPPAGERKAPAAEQNVLQAWWNGDWYGFIYLPTADGAWESLEDGVWDCFATIDSDAAGTGSIYLWDDGGELGDVELQITEHGVSSAGVAMSESGRFNEMEIGHVDWIIDPGTNTQPYEHLIIIDGTFEDPDGSEYGGFMYEIWLRPWGMAWDDAPEEDQPPGYANWYLDRYTGPMPTMEEFLSGADPLPGGGGGTGGGQLTTVDFDAFTVGCPEGTVLEDDWLHGRMIKDESGRFEVQFDQQSSEEQVATLRGEMAAYLSDPEAKGAVEFSRTIGGMSDVYCIKYDSVIWNEAMFSVAYPQPINGYCGARLCVKTKDTKLKIDEVLAMPQVQAILDSVAFKSGA